MTYSNPLRVSQRRWLLCLIGYQIAVETAVSSSELLRGIAGAVSFAARDIAILAFSFGLA